MVRVESQVTRQALLVVGDGMETNPLPEKLELYTEDGQAVDVGKDRTRARWRGTWSAAPDAPYEQNDFVMHDEKLYILDDIEAYDGVAPPPAAGWAIMTISGGMKWLGEWMMDTIYQANDVVWYSDAIYIAPDIMPEDQPPDFVPSDPLLYTVRNVRCFQSDRLVSLVPTPRVVDADSDTFNVQGRKAEPVVLDRTADTFQTVTFYNDHPTVDMKVDLRSVGGTQIGVAQTVAPGASFDYTTSTGSVSAGQDFVFIVYFNLTDAGNFRVSVNTAANLVAPPDPSILWELILGGDSGPPSPTDTYNMADSTIVAANFVHVNDVDILEDVSLNARGTIKFVWTTGGNMTVVLRCNDAGTVHLMAGVLDDNAVHIYERLSSGFSEKINASAGMVSGNTYWVEFTCIGRELVLRLFTAAPGLDVAPSRNLVWTLAADTKLLYRGRVGIRYDAECTPLEFVYEKL